MKSDLVDIVVAKHAETSLAILVSADGDKARAIWLPKSQCEIVPQDFAIGDQLYKLTLPEWLAKDKGLL